MSSSFEKSTVSTALKAAAAVAVVGVGLKMYLRHQKRGCLPRGYSSSKFTSAVDHSAKGGECHRDGYSKKKVPEDIDTIVIGSGIGGLSCAAMLSRAGQRCVVLERHSIAGGSTHAFEEHGYEFDTGVHYIGNVEKRKKYFDLISEPGSIQWDKMGTEANGFMYDELRIGDKEYDLKAGIPAFIEEMTSKFPSERANIEKYVALVEKCSSKDVFFDLKVARPRWLARIVNSYAGASFFESVRRTALEVIREITPNKDLQAALLGQFGDYGKLPSQESFFLHASVAHHYFNGGYYPRGGSTVIARGIIPTIEKTGGRVLVRKMVSEILMKNGRAVGVKMSNGDEIYAKNVVSACGVFNTYKKLLPKEAVPKGVVEKIDEIGPSCSMVYLFVGMKGTPSELNLRSSNIWHWPAPDGDYDKMMADFERDPERAPIPLFLGFPCAKDSTWETRFPGKSNSVILTMCKYEWFEKWENEPQGKRGADYDAYKKMFENRILEEGLYKYYPQCRGKVDFTLVGTALTFNHYIGSQKGEVYGLEGHPLRFQKDDWLRPETDVPGLFLTGQDVTTLGVTGALMSGILTSHAVLGYGHVVDMVSGRNLVEDIWHLEEKMKGNHKRAQSEEKGDHKLD